MSMKRRASSFLLFSTHRNQCPLESLPIPRLGQGRIRPPMKITLCQQVRNYTKNDKNMSKEQKSKHEGILTGQTRHNLSIKINDNSLNKIRIQITLIKIKTNGEKRKLFSMVEGHLINEEVETELKNNHFTTSIVITNLEKRHQ